jgi:DNA polymerase-3 subunit beta
MKVICSQSDLNSNLSLISRAVPSRPTHPVLSNVLLVADGEKGRLSLTAFDLSLGIRTSFPAEVSMGGSVTLPAKLLNDIVAKLPEEEITIFYEDDEIDSSPLATITSASGTFQIRGMSAEEFPELPQLEDAQSLTLPIASLSEGLKGVLFAASTDDTKQILTGVHLSCSTDSLEFAATDGHRLAVVKTEEQLSEETEGKTSEDAEDFAITIPARALRELERMLATSQNTDSVALQYDGGQVVFELGNQRLTSRKLEGAYPAYQQLIPHQFVRTMVVERKQLLSNLERVAVLADQKNHLVKFALDGKEEQLEISVEAQEMGNAKVSMPVQITGEGLEIAFNIKYLMDGLKAMSSTEVQVQLNQQSQPVIFSPLGGMRMTYLLMPVQMRS